MVMAARIGDMHVCPMVTPGTPPIPHVGGPILPPCSITVLTGGIPQARITDMCVCVGPPDVITMGCPTVLVNSLMAARVGDPTVHGGVITVGLPTVLIGSGGGGGGSGGGGGGGAPGVPGPKGLNGPIAAAVAATIGALNEGGYAPLTGLANASSFSASASQARTMKEAAAARAPLVERCTLGD